MESRHSFYGNTMSFSKSYLSIRGFWFLCMVVESILCRYQGTILHKHIPLLGSCPLTNLIPLQMPESCMESQQEKWAYNQPQQATCGTGHRGSQIGRGKAPSTSHVHCSGNASLALLHPAWKIITTFELIAHSGLQIISLRARKEPVVRDIPLNEESNHTL